MKKIIFLLVVIIISLTACSNDSAEEPAEKRITPVETEKVTQDNLEILKEYYGRTSAERMGPVVATAPGEVEELYVENGDKVEEGEILATIQTAESPAPIDVEASQNGEISNLSVQQGGVTSASEPMMTIIDLDTIVAKIEVTASDLSLFESMDEAIVTIEDAGFEENVPIHYVSTVPGETGLFTVELIIDNDEHAILPGMMAIVTVTENTVEDTLLVPTAALVEETDSTFVYVVESDEAIQVPVTIIEAQSDISAVDGELSEGETVVVRGQLTLSDGSPVNIVEREENSK